MTILNKQYFKGGKMRSLLDEFLGALLGAWLGVATQIWNKSPFAIFTFIAGLGLIALLLNIVSAPLDRVIRIGAMLCLLFVAVGSGPLFLWMQVFTNLNQLWFYYIILAVWLIVGSVAVYLEKALPRIAYRRVPLDEAGE
jgi:hypothetical protein